MDVAPGLVVRRIVALGWLLVAAALGAVQVATVTAVTGDPQIARDGRPLSRRVEPGFGIEPFDAIRTDGSASLEISFDQTSGLDAVVRVNPLSHLTVEVPAGADAPFRVIGLIAGSVDLVVYALPQGRAIRVRSSVGVVHVRGARFSVTLAADGAMLVCADEGLVEVRGPRGATLYARRGEVVESDVDSLRNLRFDGDRPDEFRRDWLDRRAQRIADPASGIARSLGRRYLAARDAFAAAYADVMAHRDTIDEWIDAAERGVPVPTPPDDEPRLLESLERAHASMIDLEPLYAILDSLAVGPGDEAFAVDMDATHTVADVVRMAANDRRLMGARFATVRHTLKLSVASQGVAP